MATTSGYEVEEQRLTVPHWLQSVNRAIVLRSAVVAFLLGSILTLVNQSGWVAGSDPLQLLPFILVFLTPFAVVMVAQVAGVRQAYADSRIYGAPVSPEWFSTTITSHGIPTRALVIGLVFGSLNAALSVADELLRSGGLAALDGRPRGQAYVLPLVFGLVSQAISYRRARDHGGN